VFYDALWPYAYTAYDPFWYYGYDDIYEGIFSPYDYGEYVQGSGAPARMTALTQSATDSCNDEAAEVTGWPIDQIQSALSPAPQQTALLDALGNAIVKASDVIRSHCPTTLAFTPTDRLAQMQQRLEGLAQAVSIVQPPLAKFYDSLSDEQKARFNDIGNASAKPKASEQGTIQSPQATCAGSVMAFPTDRIDHIVQPNAAQRAKLEALAAASAKAADQIKASCPSALPATPPDRLAAEGSHLQAMLAGIETIRPALADFYNGLSDEQKARFNTVGRQLFAEK
jgi:LTXXQ motif family protein